MSLIITNAYLLQEPFEDQPLTHARIGYRTLWRKPHAVVTATSEEAGFPAVAAINELTYEYWRPETLPATWELELAANETADYLGIASHTLGSSSTTLALEYYDGTNWVEIQATSPQRDDPLMIIFEQVEASRFRIRLTGATIPSVGVIFIGQTLQMMRPIYGGHSPIGLSRQTTRQENKSDRGQWLGMSLIRRGVATSFSWENLKPNWYRDFFDPFVEYATQSRGTFFIAWRPERFPNEVGYCWLSGDDIQPQNTGTNELMSVDMSVVGQIDFQTPDVSRFA